MNITKILLSIIIGVAVATSADAANTMCVTDDMEQVILDPNIEGTGTTSQLSSKTWTTTFSYGTISGIASCNSTSGTYATAYPEYNFDNNHVSSEGVYCWCRMTSPVRSAWVYAYVHGSASECASYCVPNCAAGVRNVSNFRVGMFNSAGM